MNDYPKARSGKVDINSPTGKAVSVLINQRHDLRACLRTIQTLATHKPNDWEETVRILTTGALEETEQV